MAIIMPLVNYRKTLVVRLVVGNCNLIKTYIALKKNCTHTRGLVHADMGVDLEEVRLSSMIIKTIKRISVKIKCSPVYKAYRVIHILSATRALL